MRMNYRQIQAIAVGLIVATAIMAGQACAAKSARDRMRAAAPVIADAVNAIDDTEFEIYRSGAVPSYDKAAHDAVGLKVTALLYASRAYTRAVRAGLVADANTEMDGLKAAVRDLESAIPRLEPLHGNLMKAIDALRLLLPDTVGTLTEPPGLLLAQTNGAMGVLALLQLALNLIASNRTSVERILGHLKAEGATDEELDAVEAATTGRIHRREEEHGTDAG